MKRIYVILTLAFISLSMTACYKDLGNYDYHDINELAIDSILSFYTVDQFDTLKIDPLLTGTQYSDSSRFAYVWEIAGDTVSTHLNLRYRVMNSPGEKYCRFIVTDKETGVREYTYFYTTVVSATAVDGILLLGNYDGHSELSFKRLDRMEAPFQENIFQVINGEYLGMQPQQLVQWYNYEATSDADNYGLHVLTDGQIKRLSDKTLMLDEVYPVYNQGYFKSIIPVNPSYPDFGDFASIQSAAADVGSWQGDFMGLFSTVTNYWFIYGGKYFMTGMAMTRGGSYATSYLRESEMGGELSPVCFKVSTREINSFSSIVYNIGYNHSDYMILFDVTNHCFVYGSCSGQAAFKEITEFRGTDFTSFEPVFGSPTRNVNNPFVVMSDGNNFRCLMLQAPQNSGEYSSGIEFRILHDLDVPQGMMNEYSDFYCYVTDEDFYFSTDGVLYSANIQSMINGSWNAKPICELSDFGYDENATINCFEFTRSGEYIALGIATDGKRPNETSSELNGDVLLLKIDKTSNNAVSLFKKFEHVSGTPADIIFKYLTYYCKGLDYNKEFRDYL